MLNTGLNPAKPEALEAFQLKDLHIDATTGRVSGPGGTERLDPKVMAVLTVLAAHPRQLVSRERILDAVWPGRVVSEEAVSQCISKLRRAFANAGGSSRHRKLIETLPRRGYRLRGSVAPVGETMPEKRIVRRSSPAVLLVLLVLAFAAWFYDRTSVAPAARPGVSGAAGVNSIAVMPFADLSPEGDHEYFAHGISEEILNRLSSVGDLHVIARTSSFAFQNSGFGAPQLCQALGVGYLLDGSVRKDGDMLRISTHLVDASGFLVWNAVFDRSRDDIFAIQTEIAEAVASSILPEVSPLGEVDRLPDLDAYDLYL
ncbi:MAG: winged helix-turn-helix domain-containing protein, partial [Xanthomonadales bacterium]|nr:winged helix-turn-helix domain-containing protein [Xanthomonadales bacterium]